MRAASPVQSIGTQSSTIVLVYPQFVCPGPDNKLAIIFPQSWRLLCSETYQAGFQRLIDRYGENVSFKNYGSQNDNFYGLLAFPATCREAALRTAYSVRSVLAHKFIGMSAMLTRVKDNDQVMRTVQVLR